MEALMGLMIMYSVGITIAFFCVLKSRSRYVNKSEFLTRKIKEMMEQNAAYRPAQRPTVQQPVQASPAEVQTVSQAQPAAPAQAAVQPQPQVQVQTPVQRPTPAPAPQPKERKITAIGVSFAVGVLLLVISAAVFISATWHTLAPGIKCIVLLGVVATVYGLSTFSRKKLDLEKTGSGLFVLGNLLVPMAIIVGFMAFGLETETYIMLLMCALSFLVTGFIGYKLFGAKFHVAVGYFGFVWSVIFICMQTIEAGTGFVFGICFAALITGIVHFAVPKLKFFDWFAEISCYAAVTGFIGAYFIDDKFYFLGLAAQLFFLATTILINRRRGFMKFVSPFFALATLWGFGAEFKVSDGYIIYSIVFILASAALIALYRLIKQETFVSNIAFAGGIPVSMWVLYASALDKSHNVLFYTIYILPVILALWVLITSKYPIERKCYCYYMVLTAVIMCRNLINEEVNLYLILAFVVVAVAISLKKENPHLVLASCCAFTINTIASMSSTNKELIFNNVTPVIMAGVTVAAFAAYIAVNRKNEKKSPDYLFIRIVTAMTAAFAGCLLLSVVMEDKAPIIPIVFFFIINILFVFATLADVDNYLGVIPVIMISVKLVTMLLDLELDNMVVGLIIMAVYVVLGRLLFCEKVFGKGRIDWLTIAAFIMCFLPIENLSKALVLLTLYSLTFIGRFSEEGATIEEKLKSHIRPIISVSVFLAAMVFVVMDVDYSDIINLEIRLAIMIAASAVIAFVIKPGKAAYWVFFSVICLSLELEAMKAVSDTDPIPLSLITVGSLGLFFYSFIVRKRSWFIVSIVMISEIGVFFAIEYWEDKLWWIYLLGMGAVMIVTASVNEFRRRNSAKIGEEKKKKLFADWTW